MNCLYWYYICITITVFTLYPYGCSDPLATHHSLTHAMRLGEARGWDRVSMGAREMSGIGIGPWHNRMYHCVLCVYCIYAHI